MLDVIERKHNESSEIAETFALQHVFNLPKDFDPNLVVNVEDEDENMENTDEEDEETLHEEIIALRKQIAEVCICLLTK